MSSNSPLTPAALVLLLLICASWGLNQVAVKVAGDGFGPFSQAALRSVGAAVILLVWLGLRGQLSRPDPKRLLWYFAIGALFAAEFALYYIGMQTTSASRGVLFFYTSPFFVALGAHVLFKDDRLTGARSWGLAVAFLGLALILGEGLFAGSGWRGDLLILVAAVLWGATTLVIKASPLREARPEHTLFAQLAVSGVFLAPAALILEPTPNQNVSALVWSAMIYQIVIVAGLSYLAWFAMILRYRASTLASFTFAAPGFGVLFGIVLLSEPFSLGIAGGLVMISIGIWLVNRREDAID